MSGSVLSADENIWSSEIILASGAKLAYSVFSFPANSSQPGCLSSEKDAWGGTTMRSRNLLSAAILLAVLLAASVAFAAEPVPFSEAGKPAAGGASTPDIKPFSTVAVGATFGTLGPGFLVATPLSRHLNLRGNAAFFNYSTDIGDSGIDYSGSLALRNGRVSLDYYPWAKGFRLSPGVMVYNQLDINASAIFESKNSFTLDNTDYYSSTNKPLTGKAAIEFGNKVAPTFSIGWGNAIPRTGRHLGFGVELGVAYTGTPKFDLTVTGSACTTPNSNSSNVNCFDVNNLSAANAVTFNQHLTAQKKTITDDLNYVKAYPILDLELTYRF
jgi:hypothetical protein